MMKPVKSICIIFLAASLSLPAQPMDRPRIIVTTDITNEPDDQESLIRLLCYANDFAIEGLIGSTGIWKLCDPATHVIHECIDAYAEVLPNLSLHDPHYPTAEYLHTITVTGNRSYGMSGVGERVSRGAQIIIDAVDRDDARPVWCLVWGGANTVAQALWTVQQTRSQAELDKFLTKMRVYDLAGQDDAGAWMAKTFPDLFIIRNVKSYKGMSQRFSSEAWQNTQGGDESVTTRAWVAENIQNNHGAMGKMYPDALHIWEGDTPTYFYLMPNGLNDSERPWQGSWGGRFKRDKQKNVNIIAQEYAGHFCEKGGCFVNELPYLDYWMYADAEDHWSYQGTDYDNVWCAIFRWRGAFQNDFAARMDRCILPFDQVNHNPVIAIDGSTNKAVTYQSIAAGTTISLNASDSSDPDGDEISFDWWQYTEAGTYQGYVDIETTDQSNTNIAIPADASGKDIHIVLTVQDTGTPPLTAYHRWVVSVK